MCDDDNPAQTHLKAHRKKVDILMQICIYKQ